VTVPTSLDEIEVRFEVQFRWPKSGWRRDFFLRGGFDSRDEAVNYVEARHREHARELEEHLRREKGGMFSRLIHPPGHRPWEPDYRIVKVTEQPVESGTFDSKTGCWT